MISRQITSNFMFACIAEIEDGSGGVDSPNPRPMENEAWNWKNTVLGTSCAGPSPPGRTHRPPTETVTLPLLGDQGSGVFTQRSELTSGYW